MQKSATVADLRNHFPSVYKWILEGEQVELTKRGKLIARIVPASEKQKRVFQLPDFNRLQVEVFGPEKQKRLLSPEDSAAIRDRGER